MKKKNRSRLCTAGGLLALFVLWTVLVCHVDVKEIGPMGSAVGFSALNSTVHSFTGVHMFLYILTDWLGLVPFAVVSGFAVTGLIQWIKRRRLLLVDRSILVLGGFYIVVLAIFVLFEKVVVNYRPVLIEGVLEASYPSSTTTLVLCVMSTAAMQLNTRIKNDAFRQCVMTAIAVFSAFMVIGRVLSGVHWITDIIGGVLLSAGLVVGYGALAE